MIAAIIVGLIVAGVTQLSLPEFHGGNFVVATLLGLDGALAGFYLASQFLHGPGLGSSLFLSFLSATLLLTAYRSATLRLPQAASKSSGVSVT